MKKAPKSEVAEISHIMKHAAKHAVLTRAEEVELIQTFQTSVQFMCFLIASSSRRRRKTQGDRCALFYHLAILKRRATARLVTCNLRLIVKYALSYMDRGLPLTDLVNEGADGLIHAVELFDLSTGNKLSTYSTQWIRQRMGRAIENKSRVVKISPNKLAQITKLKKIYRKWVEKHGEPPTSEELSEQFWDVYGDTVSPDECKELGRLQHSHTSLDETIGEDENISLGSYLACDERLQPENQIEKTSDKSYVSEQLLGELEDEDEEAANFLRLKYGFIDDKERSDKEMAAIYAMTSKEVRAREKEILDSLRKMADRQSINTDFLCDVILHKLGRQTWRVVSVLKEMFPDQTLSSLLRCTEEGPFKLASRLPQDKAEELCCEFLEMGAAAELVNVS